LCRSREEFLNPELAERWDGILAVRKEVTKALELGRKEKIIGHPLDAAVTLGVSTDLREKLEPYAGPVGSIFIVSSVKLVDEKKLEGRLRKRDGPRAQSAGGAIRRPQV
jgi:isoleucyl-tRNA synthetase